MLLAADAGGYKERDDDIDIILSYLQASVR